MTDPPPPTPTLESSQEDADTTPSSKPQLPDDDLGSSTPALDSTSTAPPPQPITTASALPPLLDQLSMRQPALSGMPTTRRPISTRTTSRPLSRTSLESTMDELNQVSRGVSEGAASKWLPEPENSLRRPFWQLSRLRATITTGGFLTPRLHVPRLVWEQYGAKLNGLTTKATAFEAVLSLLVDRVLPLELLSSASDAGSGGSSSSSSGQNQNDDGEAARKDLPKAQKALRVLEGVRAEFDFLQNSLARPFPYIKEVPNSRSSNSSSSSSSSSSKSSVAMALASSSSSSTSTSSSSGAGGMQQIRGFMASFGKKIQKSAVSAMTAVERIGVALPAKISDEDLLSYASLVSEMCHKSQRLDEWFVSLDGRRKELQDALRREASASGASSSSSSSSSSFSSSSLTGKEAIQALLHCVEGMLVELLHCARFLQEVVIELLLRDVESLVDSYLRKARKVFTRMVWELEEQENS